MLGTPLSTVNTDYSGMTNEHLRLFFAIPCSASVSERLVTWSVRNCPDGSALHPNDLHVTLAFLGSQPAEHVPVLHRLAASLPLPALTIELGTAQRWSDLLVLLPRQVPDALLTFQKELSSRLHALGVAMDTRPYRPHLTLMRRLPSKIAPPSPPPFSWSVREWGLFRSHQQVPRYQCLASWPTIPHP